MVCPPMRQHLSITTLRSSTLGQIIEWAWSNLPGGAQKMKPMDEQSNDVIGSGVSDVRSRSALMSECPRKRWSPGWRRLNSRALRGCG